MRDAHLLGLALLAAIAPACKKPVTDGAAPPETSVTTGGVVVTTPTDPVEPVASTSCDGSTLPEPVDRHTLRYADGTTQPLAGLSGGPWEAASARLIAECEAKGGDCPSELLPPAELLCRVSETEPGASNCAASLNQQMVFGKKEDTLAWHLSCGWLMLQVDPQTAQILSRSEIMEGRPLMTEDGALVAPVVGSEDPEARHWLQMAAAERASVHSFLRHADELRSLGAPAALIEAATAAAEDEARHAALCIALAGEGALGAMPPTPPARRGADAILTAVLVEGCINETIAALLVRRSAEATEDPGKAAVLRAIAEDETRHAALAWRTLAWGLRAHPHLRATLKSTFEREIHGIQASASPIDGDGILPVEAKHAAIRDALEHAVAPAWALCLGRSSTRDVGDVLGALPA